MVGKAETGQACFLPVSGMILNWLQSGRRARGKAQPPVPSTRLWLWFLGKRDTCLKLGTKAWFPEAEGSKQGSRGKEDTLSLGLAVAKDVRVGRTGSHCLMAAPQGSGSAPA